MEFKKISSPSLRDLFVEQIQHMILSGKLKVGEKLPPERELAQAMQVSRAVVNGGLAELERKGFLVVKPRSGTYVSDFRRTGTLDTLIAIMNYNGGQLKDEEVRSIFEVRIALDSLAARLCIHDISDENIRLLYSYVERLKHTEDISEAASAAFGFQHEFALISGNSLLPLIFQSFKSPLFSLWERFCIRYGIPTLYENNYKMWTYIRDRDTEGAIAYIEESMHECIHGNMQIYLRK